MTDHGDDSGTSPVEPGRQPGIESARGPAFAGPRPGGWTSTGGPGASRPDAPASPDARERDQVVADVADEPSAATAADRGAPADAPIDAPANDLAPPSPAEPAEAAEPDPIMALTRERDDYRDALIRLQADFENYKKRMIKQQTDHLERAAAALVDKLLPVLDTADLALAHGGGEDVKQVTGALTNVLEREGLERIDPVGDPFDPTLHDAVAHEPSDDGQQEVVEVMRAGYRWKGRVLRPAMVKVRG
jgi:molecular chaperone GrpE